MDNKISRKVTQHKIKTCTPKQINYGLFNGFLLICLISKNVQIDLKWENPSAIKKTRIPLAKQQTIRDVFEFCGKIFNKPQYAMALIVKGISISHIQRQPRFSFSNNDIYDKQRSRDIPPIVKNPPRIIKHIGIFPTSVVIFPTITSQ